MEGKRCGEGGDRGQEREESSCRQVQGPGQHPGGHGQRQAQQEAVGRGRVQGLQHQEGARGFCGEAASVSVLYEHCDPSCHY